MAHTGWRGRLARLWAHAEMFVFGAAMSWVAVPYLLRRRQERERLFAMLVSARMMGVPCMPASHELRLLPYLVPSLLYWKRLTLFSGELEGVDLRHIGH